MIINNVTSNAKDRWSKLNSWNTAIHIGDGGCFKTVLFAVLLLICSFIFFPIFVEENSKTSQKFFFSYLTLFFQLSHHHDIAVSEVKEIYPSFIKYRFGRGRRKTRGGGKNRQYQELRLSSFNGNVAGRGGGGGGELQRMKFCCGAEISKSCLGRYSKFYVLFITSVRLQIIISVKSRRVGNILLQCFPKWFLGTLRNSWGGGGSMVN